MNYTITLKANLLITTRFIEQQIIYCYNGEDLG